MTRPIDHLVLGGRDLGAVVAAYRRLGFLVGGRNRHPWGTENHIVQLDGSFLELIGLGAEFQALGAEEDAAPFANTLASFLDRRDGLALVALCSSDAIEDARHFAAVGIGLGRTLHFSRTAEAADGTRRDVAFTTAFALDPDQPSPEVFVCHHHHPENFWNPAMQHHPNGARSLIGIVKVAEDPRAPAGFLTELFAPDRASETADGLMVRAGPHRIEILTPGRYEVRFGDPAGARAGGWAAYRIGVDTIEAVQRFLNVMGSPYTLLDGRLVVPPSVAGGVAISFEPST